MLTPCSPDCRKLLWMIPALSIVFAGCVTTGDTADSSSIAAISSIEPHEDLSPEERQMREDANVFRNTILGGTATGAAVGALVCILKYGTGDLEKCAKYAAIGATVGALDGYLTAKKQEASRKKVREIDLITEEIEEKNAEIRKLVESSHKVVEQNRERIEEVKLQIARNEAQEELLVEEQKRLQANIDVMDRTIDRLEKDRKAYAALADRLEQDGDDVAGLRSGVDSMNRQIAALERERNALEDINRTVRIG